MIGNALRIDIEQFAARCREENLLLAWTKAGRITPEMVARYLASLHYMLTFTGPHLSRAAERARAMGDDALAHHYEEKFAEEIGHEVWAENDRKTLQETKGATADAAMPSAIELAAYISTAIEEHPALYLAHIAFSEYITVMLGPEWMEALEKANGISRKAVTVIDKHVELDREHAEEGFAVMDDLIVDPKMLPRMREALAKSMECFNGLCGEAVLSGTDAAESGPTLAAPEASTSRRHVSAA
jgi:hypothetical protein